MLETLIKIAVQGDHVSHDIINNVLSNDNEPRTFDRAIVPMLFAEQDGQCSICKQEIQKDRLTDGDYVQVDHIKPWSKGGRTTEDNAQLVHAKCNQSKGASL